MMLIYADTDVCSWHLRKLNLDYTTNLDEFVCSSDSKAAVFHVPYPYEGASGQSFEQRLDLTVSVTDKVVILCSELHEITVDFILRYQNKNVKFFTCGFVDGVITTPWMDWFITSVHFYKNTKNNPLDKLTPYLQKPKRFDILLGQARIHRNLIYNYIHKHNLQDRVVMTYLNNSKITPGQDSSNWIWESDGLELPNSDIQWTVTPINYFGQGMSLSQVVPVNIYNQTAYSIVAETNTFDHFNFYTEKIVKPILAKRLFIVFAGHNYLKNLRSFGFRTFDSIIDESYDTVADPIRRFSLALEQMQWLFDQPQEEILQKIKPIVEHNARLMLNKPWGDEFFSELELFLQ